MQSTPCGGELLQPEPKVTTKSPVMLAEDLLDLRVGTCDISHHLHYGASQSSKLKIQKCLLL